MSRAVPYEYCWRQLISEALSDNQDGWENVVSCTLDDEGLDRKFDAGFGSPEGEPFTLWTVANVYFPKDYDGAESVGCVARHPDGKPTNHQ